jgi:hypothetical protein
MSTIICEYCESKITKYNYIKHKSETSTKIQNFLNKKNILYEKIIEENNKLKQEINILKNQNVLLEKTTEEYRKIVEKTSTKITVKNNYTHNNYLNLISQEPIKFSELSKQLKELVNCESLMYNENDFHEHIVDNILRDENGKDKVLCTDINRKNFSYKDENSGELISDPELEKLREQLRKGTDIKIIKKELLNKLIKQYENTDIDPYVKFYVIF